MRPARRPRDGDDQTLGMGLFTLALQTDAEEKRARVRQMWLRTASVRTKRTAPYVRSWLRRARSSRQRRDYSANLAIFAGVGLQC
jgi:hypothetical protein